MPSKEEKYQKLKEQLEQGFTWPSLYMFKFIVKADNQKVAQVEQLFNAREARIETRSSSKGNFISVTAREIMLSPEKVIERYRMAEKIEGVISL